jgi:hypothetical protein
MPSVRSERKNATALKRARFSLSAARSGVMTA